MPNLNPYLHFNGNAEEAFNFYKSVFGGEFSILMRNDQIPAEVPRPIDADEANQITHISLPIGNGSILMGSDMPKVFGGATQGNSFNISINCESREEVDKLFNGLSAGGKITMPVGDTFWGAYFGMCSDKYGVNWMMNFDQA